MTITGGGQTHEHHRGFRFIANVFSVRFISLLGELLLPWKHWFVGSGDIRCPFKQKRILVNVLPRTITNIVREKFKLNADVCSLYNDAFGYETLDDAITEIEDVCSRLIVHVKPDNLFFIFGQTVEALNDAFVEHTTPNESFDPFCRLYCDCNNANCEYKDKAYSEPLAIVLCKLKNTEIFKGDFWAEKKKSYSDTEWYAVTWSEFDKIKHNFHDC